MSESDAIEYIATPRCECSACGHDAQVPLGGRLCRGKARRIVARLIAQLGGDDDVARRVGGSDGKPHTNRKLAFEHGERLVRADLFQIDWVRKDDLGD